MLIKADYSAIEVLIAATMFGDERMKEALAAEDVHRATAAGLFNVDPHTTSKVSRERVIGKAAIFQLLYGMGAQTFGERVRADISVAAVFFVIPYLSGHLPAASRNLTSRCAWVPPHRGRAASIAG